MSRSKPQVFVKFKRPLSLVPLVQPLPPAPLASQEKTLRKLGGFLQCIPVARANPKDPWSKFQVEIWRVGITLIITQQDRFCDEWELQHFDSKATGSRHKVLEKRDRSMSAWRGVVEHTCSCLKYSRQSEPCGKRVQNCQYFDEGLTNILVSSYVRFFSAPSPLPDSGWSTRRSRQRPLRKPPATRVFTGYNRQELLSLGYASNCTPSRL